MIQASGFGIIIIRPPTESILIDLSPCYFYPSAPQCTFSPTALKHYIQLPSVITEHTVHLAISLTDDLVIRFPSCTHQVKDACLDYFSSKIMIPCPPKSPSVPVQCAPPVVYFSKAPTLTRSLLHQRFAHCSDDVLDTMCRKQTVQGLPKRPPPRYDFYCAICSLGKMTREIKGKTCDTAALAPGALLHMDFAFWDVVSHRGFTAMLTIIDANTRTLWLFCTSSKKPPIHIVRWFFTKLRREQRTLATVRVDEDGSLARSSLFCAFIRDEAKLGLDTTVGYASYLNGKVERPNRTVANKVHCVLLNSDRPLSHWCYAVEASANIYRCTHHSAIHMTPHEAWYGVSPSAKEMHSCSCRVLVADHALKKSEDRACDGFYYGFAKSRSLLRWFGDTTNICKHSQGARFF
jgi:hypothetical protein